MRRAVALAVTILAVAACTDDSGLGLSPSPPTEVSTATSGPPATTSASTAPVPTTSTTVEPTPVRPSTVDELLALGRPIVLAHTGGEDQFPGSTPYAFAESMKAGVDMLDLNVQLTGDGVLVVQHDDTVDRTTDGTGLVADLTATELRELDNAYWFTAECTCTGKPSADYVFRGVRAGEVPPPPGYTADDFVIPRFRDLVAASPTVPLNVEIKGSGAPAIAAARVLAEELRELDRLDAAVVTSFDDAVVDAFHELAPEVELSPGLDASTAWVLDHTPLPDGMRILQLPPEYEGLQVITPELVADSHAAGYLIWVWPNDRSLENRASYLDFLRQGIDGLNINFPADGVAAVEEHVASGGAPVS